MVKRTPLGEWALGRLSGDTARERVEEVISNIEHKAIEVLEAEAIDSAPGDMHGSNFRAIRKSRGDDRDLIYCAAGALEAICRLRAALRMHEAMGTSDPHHVAFQMFKVMDYWIGLLLVLEEKPIRGKRLSKEGGGRGGEAKAAKTRSENEAMTDEFLRRKQQGLGYRPDSQLKEAIGKKYGLRKTFPRLRR
jgi:hypothetical protein